LDGASTAGTPLPLFIFNLDAKSYQQQLKQLVRNDDADQRACHRYDFAANLRVARHRDKLPFAVDCAILFEVGLAASRFTIHLLSAPSGFVRSWMLAAMVLADNIRILNRVFCGYFC
jgi:hypothetical protein